MPANGRSAAMWHDAATSGLMFRLNCAAAWVYGGASVFLSSTYLLYGENAGHPVGYLAPAGTAICVALWGLLCVLLYLADRGLRRRWEAWALAVPFALAGASAWICDHRYWQQI